MLEVNLEDVLAAYQQRLQWNQTPLNQMKFMYKGKPVDVDKLARKDNFWSESEWQYTGLNNCDYMRLLATFLESEVEDEC